MDDLVLTMLPYYCSLTLQRLIAPMYMERGVRVGHGASASHFGHVRPDNGAARRCGGQWDAGMMGSVVARRRPGRTY